MVKAPIYYIKKSKARPNGIEAVVNICIYPYGSVVVVVVIRRSSTTTTIGPLCSYEQTKACRLDSASTYVPFCIIYGNCLVFLSFPEASASPWWSGAFDSPKKWFILIWMMLNDARACKVSMDASICVLPIIHPSINHHMNSFFLFFGCKRGSKVGYRGNWERCSSEVCTCISMWRAS